MFCIVLCKFMDLYMSPFLNILRFSLILVRLASGSLGCNPRSMISLPLRVMTVHDHSALNLESSISLKIRLFLMGVIFRNLVGPRNNYLLIVTIGNFFRPF